jgi:hypothetical protein
MDLDEIAEFIGRSNPRVALRFLDAFDQTVAKLAPMPGLGSPYESSHPVRAEGDGADLVLVAQGWVDLIPRVHVPSPGFRERASRFSACHPDPSRAAESCTVLGPTEHAETRPARLSAPRIP